MLRWYLIHSKASAEASAQLHLERQRYEVYLPRLLQTVQRRGQWRERVVALFPRYLFVRVEDGRQSLSPVRSTVGVADVVRFGFHYASVRDNIISELREREDVKSGLHRLRCAPPLSRGSRVRIGAGPFGGLEGVFEREAGTERVLVLLKLLGQDASVRVPAGFVLSAAAG
jgi:transcriptional antiterminator RfaH